jgi:hypothetical protein
MISYTVHEDKIRKGWGVLRKKDGERNGWNLVSYRHKGIADEVADFLTSNADGECR